MTIPPPGTRDDADPGTRAIEEITCPIARVKAINAIARQVGTIPGPLARMRTAALQEASALTQTVTELAEQVGMTRSRVSTLLHHPYHPTTAQGVAAPC